MGGQACVSYGAAEFSRDIDLVLLPDPDNLARLRDALTDLRAEPVAFPALDLDYLRRGHAVHFRCLDAGGIRLELRCAELQPRRGYYRTLVAIANKNARIAWALLAKNEDLRAT